MRRCAFLTMDDPSGFFTYDRLCRAPFEARGWRLDEVSWRAAVDWSAWDLVVIRSPWDYQADPDGFLATLDHIAAVTHLENPAPLCRWNLDKRYLGALAARGAPIVPTLFREAGAPIDATLFADVGAEEIVVKPVVSANADHTWRLDPARLAAQRDALAATFATRAHMVQPMMRAILTAGELSLFYFDGALSHAVRKTPAAGDFRVQEEHGGAIVAVSPPPSAIAAAERALAALDAPPAYARVDLVADGEAYLLMELELVEPSLYFPYGPGSAERFVEALLRRVH